MQIPGVLYLLKRKNGQCQKCKYHNDYRTSSNSALIGCSLITGSHTSENLADIKNKILIAVTDNASNIKNAINSHLQ
jgi:hypothetical protein